MIRAVIIDDEPHSVELISNLVKLYCKQVQIVATAHSISDGLKIIKDHQPGLVFLDVQIHEFTGFDLLQLIQPIDFKVIFITAHQEFAIQAFQWSAIDYLLKPITPAYLIKAVQKVEEAIGRNEANVSVNTLMNNLKSSSGERKKIVLKTAERIYAVSVNEIVRCEADGNYTVVYLQTRDKIMVSRLIKEFDEMLGAEGFIRVHQSHLIAIQFLSYFQKSDSVVVMKDGSQIPVSSRKKEELIRKINEL